LCEGLKKGKLILSSATAEELVVASGRLMIKIKESFMPLCVVGSVALDSVETPTDVRENILGGSAVFFSYAASFFTTVRLAGVVGEDWPPENTRMLQARGIDTAGLQVIPGGKTFRWRGKYMRNMNDRETLDLQLNVLVDFDPVLPETYRRCKFLFLANGSPAHQLKTLDQCAGPSLVVADTMDHYIRNERDGLMNVLKRIDGLVLNDSEAKLLTGDDNLVRAGHAVREMGPSFVVLKKGEHGAMFFSKHETYVLPAYPTADVVDPTGAGDSFAGGMMGYLAEQDNFEPKTLKEALAYGTLAASFTVEDFSLDRLRKIDRKDIDRRMEEYKKMLSF
jgi:sugar/nucleoside kinase (ribokinase family)